MAEQKYIDFIQKLHNKTKSQVIKWGYLDAAESVYTKMGWTDGLIGLPTFDTDKSFISKIDSYYVVLLTNDKSLTDLYVIPSTYKNICVLKAEDYGEYTTRLYNLVRSRFPDADAFITNFINKP